MIVVDTNVLAYLHIPGEWTEQAIIAYRKDPLWIAPVLWKSEFRSILSLYMRKERLALSDAVAVCDQAELLMKGNEFQVPTADVLGLINDSKCSAYDCEFVALAKANGISLVTTDQRILKEFPGTAISLSLFSSSDRR
jgi:predicted nucleic acid-binding protein